MTYSDSYEIGLMIAEWLLGGDETALTSEGRMDRFDIARKVASVISEFDDELGLEIEKFGEAPMGEEEETDYDEIISLEVRKEIELQKSYADLELQEAA